MRFINDNVTLGEIEHDALVDGGLVTCQKMTGTRNIITSYTGSEEALRYFSSRFAKKEFSELGDKPRDVLGEFLNCCNGIFSSNIVEYNIDLELEPQFVTNDKKLIQSEDMIGIPFSIDNYSYQLLMAF
jgi:CheY-specific phosphatase CheX